MAVKSRLALLSTLINLVLGAVKIWAAIVSGSVGVFAEGVHSSLDVLSSLIAYFGIRISLKPVDAKHPYGYYKSETIAGLFVSIIVVISTLWVLYEAVQRLSNPAPLQVNPILLGVMLISAGVNFFMSRLKFEQGSKYESPALIADARHSEIDVWTSLAVFIGLVLSPFLVSVDGVAAIVVGLVMLRKGLEIGAETTESLLDVSAGEEVESKIKEVAESVNLVSKAYGVKTRKIGGNIFAELSLSVDPRLKVEHADRVSKDVEKKLKSAIPGLKHIIIQIKPLKFVSRSVFAGFGCGFRSAGRFERVGPEKKGKRIIIPVLNGKELNEKFGSEKYLLVDVVGGEIVRKSVIKNPYYDPPYSHGARFVKSVQADKVIVRHIGANARSNLEAHGIEIEITDAPLGKILEVLE